METENKNSPQMSTSKPLRHTSSIIKMLKSSPPPRIVRNMSDVDLGILQKAVANTCSHGHTKEKKAPRICFFYNHDRERTHDSRTLPRRRVIAYVWDPDTGTVFYGGSVYNPNNYFNGYGSQLSRAISLLKAKEMVLENTYDTQTLSEIKEAFRMGEKALTPHHPKGWDKIGERNTAYERLCKLPVIFMTNAKNHKEVRYQIRRMIFLHGVKGGFKIKCSLEE